MYICITEEGIKKQKTGKGAGRGKGKKGVAGRTIAEKTPDG